MARRTTRGRRGQQGFTLAALIVLLTILMVFAAYTVPRYWSTILQRDREQQTIWAMHQYAKAIYNFYGKHGAYPNTMDQLKDARQPRYLRGFTGAIPDPMTGEMDWLLIPASAVPQSPSSRVVPPPPPPPSGPQGTQQQVPTIPALSMKDYAGGPFVGVRPNKAGRSMLMVNGADQYDQWTYTSIDYKIEKDARAQSDATVIAH